MSNDEWRKGRRAGVYHKDTKTQRGKDETGRAEPGIRNRHSSFIHPPSSLSVVCLAFLAILAVILQREKAREDDGFRVYWVEDMKCEDVRKLLVAYADRALAEKMAGRVREHLDSCESCLHELELLQADATLLRGEPRPEVPAYIAARVMARIREQSGARRAGSGLSLVFARMGFVVGAAVGLWLGVGLGRGIVGTSPGAGGRLARALTTQAFVEGRAEGL